MTNYKEIVTKAVLSKGKKKFSTTNQVSVENPSTILGCWVINHQFQGVLHDNTITITGSYDVNIWYSYNHDTLTNVVKETNHYEEVIHMRDHEEGVNEDVIIRSLRQPTCVHTELEDNKILYTIEKELGVELVGDVKVKIAANEEEDAWDEIVEENVSEEIHDDFISDDNII